MRTEIINGDSYNIEETIDDILSYSREIDLLTECDGFYYVRLKPEHEFDEAMWKIDKKTGRVVELLSYGPDYLCRGIMDKAKPVDLATFKKRA